MPDTTELEKQPAAPAPAPTAPVLTTAPAKGTKKPKQKHKKKWLLPVILLVILGFVGYVGITAAMAKPIVFYQPAAPADISAYITATGTIQSDSTRTYFVPAQVKVKELNFKKGESVKKGDVIATFDLSDLNISMRKAKIALDNAKMNYDDTMENLDDSSSELFDINKTIRKEKAKLTNLELAKKFFPTLTHDPDVDSIINAYPGDFDGLYKAWEAQANLVAGLMAQKNGLLKLEMTGNQQKILENNLELQQIQYDETAKMVNDSKGGIVADFDGILTEMNLVQGATLSAGTTAVTLTGNDELKLRFSVNKYDVDRLVLAQPAKITFGNSQLEGQVSRIDGAATATAGANGSTSVLYAQVSAPDPNHVLKLGMEADLEILTASKKGVISVPIETVKTDKHGEYVYLLAKTQGEKAKEGQFDLSKVYVKTGISDDTNIEILEGVALGDLVATVVPVGIESGVVMGIPGNTSGGMIQLENGTAVAKPATME